MKYVTNPITWISANINWIKDYFYLYFHDNYVFEEDNDGWQVVVFGDSRDAVSRHINNPELFAIDMAGDRMRIRINRGEVEYAEGEVFPYFYGLRATSHVNVMFWGVTPDLIEESVNRCFRVNPIGDELVIEPPAGTDTYDDV